MKVKVKKEKPKVKVVSVKKMGNGGAIRPKSGKGH